MPDVLPTARKPVLRLPLQIGTSSLWSMTRGALTLVPGLLLTPVAIAVGGAIAWYGASEGAVTIAVFLVGVPVLFVAFAIAQLRTMLRARASDIVLDDDGLRVEGGRHGGVAVPWAELAGDRCVLRQERARRLTAADIANARWDKSERTGVDVTMLELSGSPPVVLAEAEAPEEQKSLHALHESIRSGRWHGRDEAAVPAGVELVRCAACGAAAVPSDAREVECRSCGEKVAMPDALRTTVRSAREASEGNVRVDRLVGKLVEQPGALRVNALFVAGGALMVGAWPLSIALGVRAFLQDDLDVGRALSLVAMPVPLIVGLFFLLRATLVDRFALRMLTLDFGARDPARPGDPFGCRACAAPLPDAGDRVVVRCGYCDADNVLGLDLRGRARRVEGTMKSLDDALGWRDRERRRWRLRLMPAVASSALGAALLWIAARPLPQTHALAALTGTLERVTDHPADEREPAVSPDGSRVALVEDRSEEARVVSVDAASAGDRKRVGEGRSPSWSTGDAPALLYVADGCIHRLPHGADPGGDGPSAPTFGTGVTSVRASADGEQLAVAFAREVDLVGAVDLDEIGAAEASSLPVEAAAVGGDAAVSPDGRRLAFVRTVDDVAQIFVAERGGKQLARSITTGGDPKSHPAWSPDGKWIAFAQEDGSGRNLFVADAGGDGTARLTSGDADACEPTWASDGWVYFAAHAHARYDVFRVRPALGELALERRLPATTRAPIEPLPPARGLERITSHDWNEHDPQLSPDGRTLAVTELLLRDGGTEMLHVGLVDLASGTRHRLLEREATPAEWARSPSFTPDARQLYFVRALSQTSLQHVEVASHAAQAHSLLSAENLAHPRVAPDGRVALQRRQGESEPWEVIVIDGEDNLVVLGKGERPVWSPDGARLAWLSRQGELPQLVVAPASELGRPEPLRFVDGTAIHAIAWMPDGERLVVNARSNVDGAESTVDLFVIDLARATAVQLTRSTVDITAPTVAPDGAIYFGARVEGQYDVMRLRVE